MTEQAVREHIVFGDWRDLRGAIEAFDPKWAERTEDERAVLWDFVKGVIDHYSPMNTRCGPLGCGKVVPHWQIYRCADCNGAYCTDCIRPHFGPGPRPHA